MTKQEPLTAWIALSAKGQPAYFLGYASSRAELRRTYVDRFGHDIETAGYTVVKVRLEVTT